MKKIKTLENYTNALLEVSAYQKKHAKVFDELNSLNIKLQETEGALKTDIKDNIKANVANIFVKATYSPAYSKSYDLVVVDSMTTPKMKKALEDAKAITRTLDKAKFEDLVEKGIIPIEVKQASFSEKELSPRVSIKEVTE